jgi:hypothetical protein
VQTARRGLLRGTGGRARHAPTRAPAAPAPAQVCRCVPFIQKAMKLEEVVSVRDMRSVVKEKFKQYKDVKDQRVIDLLIFKGRQELEVRARKAGRYPGSQAAKPGPAPRRTVRTVCEAALGGVAPRALPRSAPLQQAAGASLGESEPAAPSVLSKPCCGVLRGPGRRRRRQACPPLPTRAPDLPDPPQEPAPRGEQ